MPKVQNTKFHFYNMSAICTFVSFWQSKKDDKGNVAQKHSAIFDDKAIWLKK